jgi:transcriptional regulator GlxA family with amidase domain
LKDRRCSLHWHHYQTFKNNFPEALPVIDEPFVEDRGVITCSAGPDVASLALYLMEACFGTERLMRILRNMLLDAHQPPEHPRSSQLSDYRNLADPRVRQAVFFMEQNIASPVTAEEAAEAAGVGARQLERLFQVFLRDSPAGYFRKLRLRHAAWLLRNTRKTITDIALECGFSDSSHFAKRYREFFGRAPGHDRQNARSRPAADDQTADFQNS